MKCKVIFWVWPTTPKTKVQSLKIIIGIFIKSYDLPLDKIWDDFNDQTKNGCGQPRP